MAAFSIDCDRVHSYLCVAKTCGLMARLVLVKSKATLQSWNALPRLSEWV